MKKTEDEKSCDTVPLTVIKGTVALLHDVKKKFFILKIPSVLFFQALTIYFLYFNKWII
jgi:hypothetical protein